MSVSRPNHNTNALIEAVKNNDVTRAISLLSQGADANATHVPFADRPLALAIANNNVEMVNLLLSRKMDINATDTNGNQYAHLIAYYAKFYNDDTITRLFYTLYPSFIILPNIYGYMPTDFYNAAQNFPEAELASSPVFLSPFHYKSCMRDYLKRMIKDVHFSQLYLQNNEEINQIVSKLLFTNILDRCNDDEVVTPFNAIWCALEEQQIQFADPSRHAFYAGWGRTLQAKYTESVKAEGMRDSHYRDAIKDRTYTGCLKKLVKTLEIDPNHELASKRLPDFLLEMGLNTLKLFEFSEIFSAIKLLSKDKQIEILSCLYPQNHNTNLYKYFKHKLPAKTIEILTDHVIFLDPNAYLQLNATPEAYLKVGYHYFEKNQYDLALHYYEEARRLSRGNASKSYETATYQAGRTYLRKARTDKVVKLWIDISKGYFNEVITLNGSYKANAHTQLGLAALLLGNPKEVISNCNLALQKDSDSVPTYTLLAMHYLAAGKYKLAIQRYKKVIKLNPDDIRSRYELALAYEKDGDLKRAIECYHKIIQKKQKDPSKNYFNLKPYHLNDPNLFSKELIEIDQASVNPRAKLADILNNLIKSGQLGLCDKRTIFTVMKEIPIAQQIPLLKQSLDKKTTLGKFFNEIEFSFFSLSEIRVHLKNLQACEAIPLDQLLPPQPVVQQIELPQYHVPVNEFSQYQVAQPYALQQQYQDLPAHNLPPIQEVVPVYYNQNPQPDPHYPGVPPLPHFEDFKEPQPLVISPPTYDFSRPLSLYPVLDETQVIPSAPLFTQPVTQMMSTSLISQALVPVTQAPKPSSAKSGRTDSNKMIEDYLRDIKTELHKKNRWVRRNIFGMRIDGIPEHIEKLQGILPKEMNDDFGLLTPMDLSDKFNKVLQVFREVNTGLSWLKGQFVRDPSLLQFDKEKLALGEKILRDVLISHTQPAILTGDEAEAFQKRLNNAKRPSNATPISAAPVLEIEWKKQQEVAANKTSVDHKQLVEQKVNQKNKQSQPPSMDTINKMKEDEQRIQVLVDESNKKKAKDDAAKSLAQNNIHKEKKILGRSATSEKDLPQSQIPLVVYTPNN